MANPKIKCVLNNRQFQIAILVGIIVYILSGNLPSIKLLRLTPSTYIRPHFLLLYPANIFGIFGAIIGGPWTGFIISLFSNNHLYDREVDLIVNAAQYVLIGYFSKNFDSSWKKISIFLASVLSLIFHPTLVGYFLYRRVIVYLYWETNMLFNAVFATALYLVIMRVYPNLFNWATPDLYE